MIWLETSQYYRLYSGYKKIVNERSVIKKVKLKKSIRKPRHGRPVKAWAFRMIEKMSLMTQTVDKVKSLESDHVENTTAH